jgi:hypothetical protein
MKLHASTASSLQTATAVEMRYSKLVANLLGGTLFDARAIAETTSGFQGFLHRAAPKCLDKQTVGLAKAMGAPKASFHGWLNGKNLPIFSRMITIADECGVSLHEVILGGTEGNTTTSTCEAIGLQTNRRKSHSCKNTLSDIGIQLKSALSQTPPISLTGLARQLAMNARTLREMHPDLARQISKRWLEWNRLEVSNRKQTRESLMREAAESLASEGLTVTRKRLSALLEGRMVIFSRDSKNLCKRICDEVNQRLQLG